MGDVVGGTAITIGTAPTGFGEDFLANRGAVTFQPINGGVYFTVDDSTPGSANGFNAGSLTVWRIDGDDRDHFRAVRQGGSDVIIYVNVDRV